MSAATATPESGRLLAERLGLTLPKVESGNLAGPCPYPGCNSSDAFRLDIETGLGHCFSCDGKSSPYALAESRLGKDRAIALMVELGIFQPQAARDGNGKPADKKLTPEEILRAVATGKGVTAEGFKAFGAWVKDHSVFFPMFGPDGAVCSTFHITLKKDGTMDKGWNEKGKPSGLFFPCEPSANGTSGKVFLPQPGETWCLVEGVKDAAALAELGYKAVGLPTNHLNEKFARLFQAVDAVVVPDADEAGEKGATATAEVLHPVAKSVRVVAWPVEFMGCDLRDILKRLGREAGAEIIRTAIADAKPVNASGETVEAIDYGFIGGAELLAMDCRIEYLIPGVLAKGQHCLLGAPLKSCKSLIAIDQAVALATGGTFLGRFHVARPVRTLLISLESGWPVLQENIRRISGASGVTPEQLGNLFIAIRGPKFGKAEHLEAIARAVEEHKAEVVIVDCAYRCIPGDVASNVLSMGELLDSVGSVFEDCGSTLQLVHHSPKHIPPGDPLQLDNLAFAGFAEFAAQWLLVNRRTAYQPGTGHHELWLTIGARAGHGGLYGLNIDEGEFQQGQDREWRVEVTKADEAWKDAKSQRQAARQAEQDEKRKQRIEAAQKAIVAAMTRLGPESKTNIMVASGVHQRDFAEPFGLLIQGGDVVPCKVKKDNRKTPYDGFQLSVSDNPHE
jgi:hypothetical protein